MTDRPTDEELQAEIDKSIKEAEKPDAEEKEDEQKEKPQDDDKKVEADKKDDDAEDEGEEESGKDKDADKSEKDPVQKELESTKERYTESTREAQILAAKDKRKNEAIDGAAKITDIPEADLRAKYPQWDDMSDTERTLAKDNMIANKRFELINDVREAEKDIEAWNGKVDEFAGDPKTLVDNPDLEGKVEDFKVFAMRSSRRGVDFETLVAAFLYNHEQGKVKHKGAMFETGTGGDKKQNRSDGKLSVEESAKLRETDYNEYRRLLQAGKIAIQ